MPVLAKKSGIREDEEEGERATDEKMTITTTSKGGRRKEKSISFANWTCLRTYKERSVFLSMYTD